jgi:hypothetical protein
MNLSADGAESQTRYAAFLQALGLPREMLK